MTRVPGSGLHRLAGGGHAFPHIDTAGFIGHSEFSAKPQHKFTIKGGGAAAELMIEVANDQIPETRF